MIIIDLIGGLGNQMFQYAMGRAVAYKRNDILKLDISEFSNHNLRKYALSPFQIQESFALDNDIQNTLKKPLNKIPWRLVEHLQFFFPYYSRSHFFEQSFKYDFNVFKARKNVIFSGYWQSEKYFKHIANIIHKDFQLRDMPDEYTSKIANSFQDCNSVSIHVRRGDYVTNQVTAQHHGLCSVDYYSKAIHFLLKNTDNPLFFIFSDDINWVKDNLNVPNKVKYIHHNGLQRDYLDLWLMSRCKHNIIANSSFSWWGAWLNDNPEKIVIAPQKWFNDPNIDTSDLIPDAWIRL